MPHPLLPRGAHFLTAVTWERRPFFARAGCAQIFCEELEAARQKYGFEVWAFVVMPDHVHLLLWWQDGVVEGAGLAEDRAFGHPRLAISKVAWAVKGKSARWIVDFLKRDWRVGEGSAFADPADPIAELLLPARQPRDEAHFRRWAHKVWRQGAGYDFIAYSRHRLVQKINYIHANPVRAGLSVTAADYPWSSAANYQGLPTAHAVQVTMPMLWAVGGGRFAEGGGRFAEGIAFGKPCLRQPAPQIAR